MKIIKHARSITKSQQTYFHNQHFNNHHHDQSTETQYEVRNSLQSPDISCHKTRSWMEEQSDYVTITVTIFFLPKPLYIFTLVTKHVAESYLSI